MYIYIYIYTYIHTYFMYTPSPSLLKGGKSNPWHLADSKASVGDSPGIED